VQKLAMAHSSGDSQCD